MVAKLHFYYDFYHALVKVLIISTSMFTSWEANVFVKVSFIAFSLPTELLEDKQYAKLGGVWYVQNVSTFPNTFAVVSPLICMIWMELTRTNVVFSRIALVSYFCAEIKVLRKIWKNSRNCILAEDRKSTRLNSSHAQ